MVLNSGNILLEFLLLDFCVCYVRFFKSTTKLFDAVSTTTDFMFLLM